MAPAKPRPMTGLIMPAAPVCEGAEVPVAVPVPVFVPVPDVTVPVPDVPVPVVLVPVAVVVPLAVPAVTVEFETAVETMTLDKVEAVVAGTETTAVVLTPLGMVAADGCVVTGLGWEVAGVVTGRGWVVTGAG